MGGATRGRPKKLRTNGSTLFFPATSRRVRHPAECVFNSGKHILPCEIHATSPAKEALDRFPLMSCTIFSFTGWLPSFRIAFYCIFRGLSRQTYNATVGLAFEK